MEKLNENNPRFCAKYIKSVGLAKEKKVGWTRTFEMNGKFYIISRGVEFKVGQKVWIAKKVRAPGQEWNVHEIKIPEHFWTYEFYMNKTAKEQRIHPYEARAKTWFGNQCYIIEEVTKEYIQKTFAFRKYN